MLTLQQQELVENNLKLAYHRSHKWHKKLKGTLYELELEECISISIEAMCRSARRWDENGEGSFVNYTIHAIDNKFTDLLKKKNRIKRRSGVVASLDEPFSATKQNDMEITLHDIVSKSLSEDIILWNAQIQQVFQHLNAVEIDILTKYYLYNETQEEIAASIGTSYQAVQQKIARTIKKCQKILVINE
jgi:RNA polymerase sigma factor (sigma-70 family)